MKNIFILFLSSLLILTVISTKADKRNVLFIGNSYTGVNNLPVIVQGIATSMGDTLTYDSYTPGGKTANGHWNDATTKAKIAQGGWDYVIIQFQSQEPSFSPNQVMSNTYPFAKSLDSLVDATNSCAEVMYYMTWGRKNGDAGNCPFYAPVCTYDGMQQRLRESYLLFAQDFNSSVSPVGVAWKVLRDSYTSINLYDTDESHPSINGSFLAACVFYTSLFKTSCVTNQYLPSGVTNSDMGIMQTIASNTVMDSLANWQGNSKNPAADFSYTWNSNTLTFSNLSNCYTSSSWNFDDGSPLNTNDNPVHTFPNTGGNYNVCLSVTSALGNSDTICKQINLWPVNSSEFLATDKISVGQNTKQIIITNELSNCTLQLFDMHGHKFSKQSLAKGQTIINTNNFAKGIYLVQITQKDLLLKTQKVYNY